jgi:uncharacterized membrane protein required for colicin V production
MNFFDIITIVVFLWAVVIGWRSGFVSQFLSLLGVVVGAVLALRYGAAAGALCNIDPRFAAVAGFLIIFVLAVIVSNVAAWFLRGVLKFVGLKWVNTLLGILFSLLKGLAVLAMMFISVKSLNTHLQFVEPSYITSSYTFEPVCKIAAPVFEYLVAAKEAVVNNM